jgi:hypothetical protein
MPPVTPVMVPMMIEMIGRDSHLVGEARSQEREERESECVGEQEAIPGAGFTCRYATVTLWPPG